MSAPLGREAWIRSMFDTSGRGLEIGPSYRPIVPKKAGFAVEVVDHGTTEELRTKYAKEADVDPLLIEEVDFVWDGRPLSTVVGRDYDYVVASHVIEHVPDLLGFLRECQSVLKHDGVLVLVVPDSRRCFDVFRPLTSTGAVLQAHLDKRSCHTPATAFDHVGLAATLDGATGWSQGSAGSVDALYSLEFAEAVFKRSAASSEYFDFHAWVFTPSSFRLILQDLNKVTALELRETRFETTPEMEFISLLSRAGTGPAADRLTLLQQSRVELGIGLHEGSRMISQ